MNTDSKDSYDEMMWNWISLQFDRELELKENKTGKQLVPLFLDHILEDSCSKDVREALAEAFRKYFNKKSDN